MSLQRIFGKPMSAEDMVRKWRTNIRSQERQLDKQIRGIEQEEMKVKRALKEAATKQDRKICTMLAKEVIRSRKAKDRIHTSKAQLNSVSMQLQQQLSQMKVAGTLKKSADIMRLVNRLIKLPEIAKNVEEMQREMMKAGIIEEMMDDALNVDEEEIEEEAEGEVEKVLFELTSGLLGEAGPVATSKLPQKPQPLESDLANEEPEGGDEIEARLQALKS